MTSRIALGFVPRTTTARPFSQAVRRTPLGRKMRATTAGATLRRLSTETTPASHAKGAAASSASSRAGVQAGDVLAFVVLFTLSGIYLKYEIESNPLPERKPKSADDAKEVAADPKATKA
jgi:hypothetical protein